MARILIVDDEITMIQMTVEVLRSAGHEVFPCSTASSALDVLRREPVDLVITDLYLERNRAVGLDILEHCKTMSPQPVVIVITAFATVETAVEAMKFGAFDYLKKPFNLEDFTLCIQRALSYTRAVSENAHLRRQLRQKYCFEQIVGKSAPMVKVFKMIERVANTESTILILGESGTGKELVARALHYNSRRQHAPFIPVNCSALPEHLLESELFGHRKGSFTGAVLDKKGLFEEATGGTIFLDEIGTMPPQLQSRLLRVLQDREVRRVGENTSSHVDVRILAATNEPLEERVQDGSFREDLYYRLNVIPIELPTLRERKDDLPLMVGHFLRDKVHPRSQQPYQISRSAMEALTRHDWPGNVRELQNAVERACALAENEILQTSDLPPNIANRANGHDDTATVNRFETSPGLSSTLTNDQDRSGSAPVDLFEMRPPGNLRDFLREQEVHYLQHALAQTNGNKEEAALLLGISLATLYRKLPQNLSF